MAFGIKKLLKAEEQRIAEEERYNALESAENGDFSQLDLFTKPHKQKEILPDGTIQIRLKSKNKYIIQVKGPIIKVESKGMWNALNRGLVGEKTFNINSMTGVQHKKPAKMLVGYLQFVLSGSSDSKGGLTGAVKDENSIIVGSKDEDQLLQELQDYIEKYLFYTSTHRNDGTTIVNQASDLDELLKLKQLLEMGAITEEEYEMKKAQLL